MLDHFHLPTATGNAEVFYFVGNTSADSIFSWQKPRGKSMIDILLVAKGGNGGNGAVGANSAAAGGGGGASGAQVRLSMPVHLLPDNISILLNASSASSFVGLLPSSASVNHVLMWATQGNSGGNASAGTAGSAGTASGAPTAGNMPLGWAWATVLNGQAGIVGGAAVAGGPLALPSTGIVVTGGTGGGGLPAAAAVGTAGGLFTQPTAPTPFPAHIGGVGGSSSTTPGGVGNSGYRPIPGLVYGLGGTGGGSSHGSATGAGLFGGNGGDGAPGCGGGGGGGCLTGGTAGVGGKGGPAFCIITCW